MPPHGNSRRLVVEDETPLPADQPGRQRYASLRVVFPELRSQELPGLIIHCIALSVQEIKTFAHCTHTEKLFTY
jgi:hypothetical protein